MSSGTLRLAALAVRAGLSSDQLRAWLRREIERRRDARAEDREAKS